MNVLTNQKTPINRRYLEVLKTREKLDEMLVPSDKIEALSKALDSSLDILREVSLLSAMIEANWSAVWEQLDVLGEDPAIRERVISQFRDLAILRRTILTGNYGPTVEFVRAYERLVRNTVLMQAGIDPNDKEASEAFLLKLGQGVILQDPNPGN